MANDQDAEPTLRDIAQAAGLSVAAVSKVLNNREGVSQASRDKVIRIMTEIGYRGRGGRASPEPLTRATVLTLGRYVMNDSFYGEILAGITEAGRAEGIAVDMTVVSEADWSLPTDAVFPNGPPKAMLIVGIDDPALIDRVVASGLPCVLVNGMDRGMRLPSISPDYHFGGWMATRHILDLGHRDILLVTHPYRESIRRRVDGFRNALDEAGIPYDPARHLLDLGSPALLTIEARDPIAAHLAAMERMPTAIVCINDIVAMAAIKAVQARGLSVPGDVSVIGFDDLPAGALAAPSLTTMRVDRRELGRLAVRLLTARAADDSRPVQRICLAAALVERQSTAPPRRG